jgi:regulator of sigma E protease
LTATYKGFEKTGQIIGFTFLSIIKIFQKVIPAKTIGGPIAIFQMAGEQAKQGWLNLVFFMALLSVNLGILNLLPIPILDGGHIFFLVIEGVWGKPVSIKKQEIAQRVGMLLLISLMLFAFYNDIMRLWGNANN